MNVGHSHGSCCALQREKHTQEARWERMRTAEAARRLHAETWFWFFPGHTNKVLTVFSKSSKKSSAADDFARKFLIKPASFHFHRPIRVKIMLMLKSKLTSIRFQGPPGVDRQ